MSIDSALDKMTLADQLEAMEMLWADISRSPDKVPSPGWHGEVLAERRRLVEQGKLNSLDWEVAIAELRKEVRGNPDS
ncbi:MAG: addiction module protein [Pirellulales bacterium]